MLVCKAGMGNLRRAWWNSVINRHSDSKSRDVSLAPHSFLFIFSLCKVLATPLVWHGLSTLSVIIINLSFWNLWTKHQLFIGSCLPWIVRGLGWDRTHDQGTTYDIKRARQHLRRSSHTGTFIKLVWLLTCKVLLVQNFHMK